MIQGQFLVEIQSKILPFGVSQTAIIILTQREYSDDVMVAEKQVLTEEEKNHVAWLTIWLTSKSLVNQLDEQTCKKILAYIYSQGSALTCVFEKQCE